MPVPDAPIFEVGATEAMAGSPCRDRTAFAVAFPMRSGPGRLKTRRNQRGLAARVIANAAHIDTLIIGTGTAVWLPPSWLRDRLRKVSVGIDAMQTGPAIRTYNIMIGERRRVAAALIAVP